MNGLAAFGVLLMRLLDRRKLDIRELADIAGLLESEVEAVVDGAEPSSPFLRRIAPALGLRAPDLFVIAAMPVPEELAPLDSKAGGLVPSLAQHAAELPPESRARLLGFARSLPQHDRTRPVPEPKAYEQYPPGFGGMLLRMLANRNLNLWYSAEALARLTGGRVYLSASTVGLVGRGRKEITPGLLGGFAAVLGIPAADLAALGDVDMADGDLPVSPAVADAAELIWEVRRLTAEQVRQVNDKTWALCRYRHKAHLPRELVAVTETGTDLDRTWAQQAIDELLTLDEAAGAARAAGKTAVSPEILAGHEEWYRKAAAAGIALNVGRYGKLQEKRHALATRMQAREDNYLRFTRDLRIPFTNNAAEQAIRMSKLRIKISGCMRSMTGAEEFCAIRSCLATAARHGTSALEALTSAFQGRPWIPGTG
jgi:hypothetical protein